MARAIREALGLVATTPLSDMLIDWAASAAIAAMREPSEAMIEAGADVILMRLSSQFEGVNGHAIEAWWAMIDAALAEGSDADQR